MARSGWVSNWRRLRGVAVPRLPEMGKAVAVEVALALLNSSRLEELGDGLRLGEECL